MKEPTTVGFFILPAEVAMRSRTAVRVRRSEADWRRLLDEYARSGKTQEAFCRDARIPASTFEGWSRRLRSLPVRAEFIDVTPARRDPWSIKVVFPDGTTARVRGS